MKKLLEFFLDAYDDSRMPWWVNLIIQVIVCVIAAVTTMMIMKGLK